MVGYTAVVEALSLEGNVALGAWGYTMGSWAAKVRVQAFPNSEMYHSSCASESFFSDTGSVRDGRTEKLLPSADRHRTSLLCTLHRGGQNVTLSGCILYNSTEFFLLSITEPRTDFVFVQRFYSGSNVAAMETSVRLGPDNRGYVITGKKSWVTNAPNTDYFIVIAKHDGLGVDVKYSDPQRQFNEVKKKLKFFFFKKITIFFFKKWKKFFWKNENFFLKKWKEFF